MADKWKGTIIIVNSGLSIFYLCIEAKLLDPENLLTLADIGTKKLMPLIPQVPSEWNNTAQCPRTWSAVYVKNSNTNVRLKRKVSNLCWTLASEFSARQGFSPGFPDKITVLLLLSAETRNVLVEDQRRQDSGQGV
jgi:hypothetical protein